MSENNNNNFIEKMKAKAKAFNEKFEGTWVFDLANKTINRTRNNKEKDNG